MKQNKLFYRVLFLCPLLLGVIGFTTVDHLNLFNAVFSSMLMYFLNYSDPPTNIWVELARWTAPLATASSILLLISSVKQYTIAKIKSFFMDSVVVYGPDEDVLPVLSQLSARGIRGEEKLLPAKNYILLDSQEKNISFLEANQDMLHDSQIYMRCDSLPAQSVSPANVHLFQPMESTARLFWKSDELLSAFDKKDGKLTVVFVGFGKLGEELLYWGLQNNVFSPNQRISYHIFGSASEFLATHPMLEHINDPVVTYDDDWKNHISVFSGADLILVPPQEDGMAQESIIYQMLSLVHEKKITAFTNTPLLLTMLDEQSRLRIVNIGEQALQVSHIMESDLLRNAMMINLRYAHLYKGVEETDANAQSEWLQLSSFLRYSNISSADYHDIRRMIIKQMGGKPDGTDLNSDQKELLAELEHMRWCRYYWLNNWRYGVPENGKAKDELKRIHIDLVDYGELPEKEKEKDRDTIGVMLEL